jgi:hypothetical protein
MENRFYNRDFEQLVKNSADQYRMFPSEKVWKGINNKLHTRRRWYGAGLAFLLLSIGTVTWVMLTNPSTKNSTTKNLIGQNTTAKKPVAKKESEKEIFIAPKISRADNQHNSAGSPLPGIGNTIAPVKNDIPAEIPGTDESGSTADATYASITQPVKTESIPVTAKPINSNSVKAGLSEKVVKEPVAAKNINIEPQIIVYDNSFTGISGYQIPDENNKAPEKTELNFSLHNNNSWPLTIESVVNSYVKKAVRNKISWQLYFAPTVTYRSLKVNTAFIKAARAASNPLNGNSPAAVNYSSSDLANVIEHKPDIGFQLGTSVGYPVSGRFRLITGLQFNVNKYDIKAYSHTTEVATISLNTLGRSSSVSTVTSYRVVGGGYNANWLRNFYFSASVPVGIEYVIAKGKRSYFGISGTVQPTYVLDNKSYLVSTDYKNYVQAPSLTRQWNVNTGAEIFAGIINKRAEWRISPQVRYQTLSSYKNTYPVKEKLFDFGLKMGFMLR